MVYAQRLGLIEDLVLLSGFKEAIKESHAAFQIFADAFELEAKRFLAEARSEIAGVSADVWERYPYLERRRRISRVKELWSKHTCTQGMQQAIVKLESNDPKHNKNLDLHEHLEQLRKDSPVREQFYDKLNHYAGLFLEYANQIFPEKRRFESHISTAPTSLLLIIADDVVRKARGAAWACDDLMRCAEQANTLVSQQLRNMHSNELAAFGGA